MLMAMINQIAAGGERPDRAELEELLLDLAAGDREALAQIYRRTRAAVYAMAVSFLKDPQEAQDVSQDVFVRIWESAPKYRPQGSPMAWIMTIARNLSLMKLRERGRLVQLDEEEWNAIPAEAPSVTTEDRALLQAALSRLSDEERRIILLHAVSGLKHREIAQVLELPLSTVLSKYHRGIKKVRNEMKGETTQ